MAATSAPEGLDPNTVDDAERDFKVVFVPADLTKPLSEVTVRQPAGDAIGCLIAHCKSHFASTALGPGQLEAYRKQVEEHAKGQAIPDQMLQQLATTTTVDMVVLQSNKAESQFVSINMYVDDKGVAKQLEMNTRASAICQACGTGSQIYGDAFIGMQFDNNEGFSRMDFGLDKLSDDAWIAKAREANLAARSMANKVGLNQLAQPPPPKSEAELAAEREQRQAEKKAQLALRDATKLKESGNVYFNRDKSEEAIAEYTKGIDLLQLGDGECPARAVPVARALFSNRSACNARLKRWEAALADADACVKVAPDWPKAHGRRSDALMALGRLPEAKAALEKALALKPASTKDFDERLASVTAALAKS